MAGFDYIGEYRYHVVMLTDRRRPHLAQDRWASLAVSELERIAAMAMFALDAFCVMPDHVHVLLSGETEGSDLQSFAHRFKQSVGHHFRQAESVSLWQRSYYDHILRRDEPAIVHAAYILGNPVRAGLVDLIDQWSYSGPASLFSEVADTDRSEHLSLRVEELRREMEGELRLANDEPDNRRK